LEFPDDWNNLMTQVENAIDVNEISLPESKGESKLQDIQQSEGIISTSVANQGNDNASVERVTTVKMSNTTTVKMGNTKSAPEKSKFDKESYSHNIIIVKTLSTVVGIQSSATNTASSAALAAQQSSPSVQVRMGDIQPKGSLMSANPTAAPRVVASPTEGATVKSRQTKHEQKRRGCPCCDPDNLDNLIDRMIFLDQAPM
jgi:hypothetical protein